MTTRTPQLAVFTGQEAWDVIWKWEWFTRGRWQGDFRRRKEGTRRALASLLPRLGVRSVLDCTCGPGFKTILLAEMGYDVDGSDGSAVAVRYARQLAHEEGHRIRFFVSRWQDLGRNAPRTYDCIYNDAYAWTLTRRELADSARGFFRALNPGGKFIFVGAHQWSKPTDGYGGLARHYKKLGPFEALPIWESDGTRLISHVAREMTPDGVLEHRVYVIERGRRVRVEVASILDSCRWSWQDYRDVLRRAGFSKLYSVRERGVGTKPYIINVAVK